MAALIAAIIAGLIPSSTEAIEPSVNNNQQVILVKTGDNTPSVPTGIGQPSNFPTPPSRGQPSRPVSGANPYIYRTPPKVVDQGLGAAGNPAGAGGGGAYNELDDILPIPDKQKLDQNNPEHPSFYSKKKKSAEQCLIDEQNKGGIDELPDSSKVIYNLETKAAKQTLRKIWKNPEAKKEVLAGLARIDRGELLPRNQKNFKGFKTLKEIKLTKTRMLVQPGKNGAPDTILAIFMRRDMDDIVLAFKNKYK